MDVREKLVELQLQADIADNVSENTTQHREFIADFMIANSVTVQELEGCKHCIDGKTIETDIDGEIEIVKIIPLPAIDLVTGEQERKAASPYWAMRLLLDGGEDFVRIHFCPLCGRRLPQPPKGE